MQRCNHTKRKIKAFWRGLPAILLIEENGERTATETC